MKIYTKTGDKGRTSLFGGKRVSKAHRRLEAYGTLDELNGYLGWFRSLAGDEELGELVEGIQSDVFDLGAHLATPAGARKARRVLPPLHQERVKALETAIDRLETELEPLNAFILPGGAQPAAILHVARAVCRRAERAVVRAGEGRKDLLEPLGLAYLNRLSDLLFTMARVVNRRARIPEKIWTPERPG